jgi:type I restriction enzyme S subunit
MDGDFVPKRWIHGQALLNQRVCRIQNFRPGVAPGFVFYLLTIHLKKLQSTIQGSTVAHLSSNDLLKSTFPLPPLEVQQDIVGILDTFTELEAELEAELVTRNKQYHHYRESLLTFSGARSVEMVPLSEIATRNSGTAITAEQMRNLHDDLGEVTVFAAGATKARIRREDLPPKDIVEKPGIVVKSRGYIGFEFCETPFTHKSELWSYCIDENMALPKFVKHFLETQSLRLQSLARSKSVKLPQLSVADTDKLLVPLPSIVVQSQICSLLDRFEALTKDITSGLPAEIDARRKQYEYYRNQLLTFKELVA